MGRHAVVILASDTVQQFGEVHLLFALTHGGLADDFLGLYCASGEHSVANDEYEASLKTHGKAEAKKCFIAPHQCGRYEIRLIRHDEVCLASETFRVVERQQ